MSFFSQDGELIGEALLITCHSGSSLFLLAGMNSRVSLNEPFFSDLEAYFSCRAVNENFQSLIDDTGGPYKTNSSIHGLIERTPCFHPSIPAEKSEHCENSRYQAILSLLNAGVDLNDPKTCGYLRYAALQMNERMFTFLLENGADPDQKCPPYSDDRTSALPHRNETVGEMLEHLLSEYTDEEKTTIVGGWTRMLEAIRSWRR